MEETADGRNSDRKALDLAFLSGTREFRNDRVLDYKEFTESRGSAVEKCLYGDNHRRGSTIFFRDDHSPDPRTPIKKFPHHKHVKPENLIESNIPIDLSVVLEEIAGMHTEAEE